VLVEMMKRNLSTAHGTGFITKDEGIWIITNKHLVENAVGIGLKIMADGRKIETRAEIVYLSPRTDIAILRLDENLSKKVKYLKLGNSDSVTKGEFVVAIGNPYGFNETASVGIISNIVKKDSAQNENPSLNKLFQMDMSINPGNSGSPLLNLNKEVIGVVFAVIGDAQGMAFAIPINLVKEEIKEMKKILPLKQN